MSGVKGELIIDGKAQPPECLTVTILFAVVEAQDLHNMDLIGKLFSILCCKLLSLLC